MTLLSTLLEAAEVNAASSDAWANLCNKGRTGSIQDAAEQAKTFADAAHLLVETAAMLVQNDLQ